MTAIGTPMTQTVPTVGTSGTAYASTVNLFLDEVKLRLEAQVPLSSILVSLLDMQNNGITGATYLGMYPATSPPTAPVDSIQSYNGELYYVSSSGAVQITSGGSLNAAGISGITGDYGGANPAQWRFVDADKTFYAYDDFGAGTWADAQARHLYITGSASGVPRLKLTWAGVSSYTLTFPAAVPAAQALLQMDTSGVVTATNLGVRGLGLVASTNILLGAGSKIIFPATADITHGERRMTFPVTTTQACLNIGGTTGQGQKVISTATPWRFVSASLATCGIRYGDRITKVRVRYSGNDGSAVNVYAFHWRGDTGLASTDVTGTTGASGHIEVVPGSGKNTIEEHDTFLDDMFIEVAGSSATAVSIQVEIYWDRA